MYLLTMAEAQTVIGYSFEHSYTYGHKRISEIITMVPLVHRQAVVREAMRQQVLVRLCSDWPSAFTNSIFLADNNSAVHVIS